MANLDEQLRIDLTHESGDFESSPSGDIKRAKGRRNVEQALFHRLITSKGTLAHRPEYGVGIKDYQGSLPTLDSQRNLALEISNQFNQDSRVTSVDEVRFEFSDTEPDKFSIFVNYSIVGYNNIGTTFDPFEIGG